MVLEAINQNGGALKHAAPEQKADCEIVLEGVGHHASALKSATPTLRADREFMFKAAREPPAAFSEINTRATRCSISQVEPKRCIQSYRSSSGSHIWTAAAAAAAAAAKCMLCATLQHLPDDTVSCYNLGVEGGGVVAGTANRKDACCELALQHQPDVTVPFGAEDCGVVAGTAYSKKACYELAPQHQPENTVYCYNLGVEIGWRGRWHRLQHRDML